MNALMRALRAEALKLRGTLALWMCAIAPATVAMLLVLQFTLMEIRHETPPPPQEAWLGLVKATLQLWAFLMMPLFITLQSALLAGLEHANQQWKHLLALPVPKSTHFLAKLVAMTAMLAFSMALLLVLVPVGGWMLTVLQPAFGIAGPPPWAFLLRSLAACFAAGLLVTAFHTWAAIRWRSFTVAVSIGMTATVVGFLAMQSQRYGHWFPWSMPLHAIAGDGRHMPFAVTVGSLGGLAVAAAGLLDFRRREHG